MDKVFREKSLDQSFDEFFLSDSNVNQLLSIYNATGKDRYKDLENLLRLDRLQIQELTHFDELILNNLNYFHIPGKQLKATVVFDHHIPTTDDNPIASRRYRFLLINHKFCYVMRILVMKLYKEDVRPYVKCLVLSMEFF